MKKRFLLRRWNRGFQFYVRDMKRLRGAHDRWSYEGREQLRWEEYEAKCLAEGKEFDGEEPF